MNIAEHATQRAALLTVPAGSYQPRPIRPLNLWTVAGWYVKVYGICSFAEYPEPRLVEIARELARSTLPQPARTDTRYGLAFVTIHQAELFNQIIIDWWACDNELRHRVFKAALESPYAFDDITATGEAFCIWELRVIGFERDAWIQTVLDNPGGPNPKQYLARRINETA